MIITNKKTILFIFIVIVLYLYWNLYTSATHEVAKIVEVSKNEMTVVNLSNRERTVKIPNRYF